MLFIYYILSSTLIDFLDNEVTESRINHHLFGVDCGGVDQDVHSGE